MNKIRTFFSDIGTLSRWDFYVKYFLPVLIIAFSWILIGDLIELNYSKNNLNKITGTIENIEEVLIQGKREYNELRISLNNYPKYFRITDNFKYQNIQEKLKIGDEIQIYFRPKYLVPFGLGKETDIYQLEYKKEILYDIAKRKKNSKGLIVFSLIALTIFGTAYYFGKIKLNKKSYR
jgi:hypothetical protein